ncbi:MAK10-like protein [Tanacetum coccineum]
MQFLMNSRRRYAVSSLLDMAYVVRIRNLQISSFKLQNAINDAIKVTLFDVITHLAPKQPIQVNKITYSCEICSGPHDTQYYVENPKQAFVEYASSHTDKERGKRLGDSKPFDTLADLGSCVNIIPLYLFKKLNIRILEETDHIFGLADGTKSYLIGIDKVVEVHIGRLKLLTDFYVIDMKKDPETPLLVGRGFLATANAVIDHRKAKISIGERITRSVFGVKGVDLGKEEAPYLMTLGKGESYKPRPSSDCVVARTL